jgi:hypothetical protein
VKDARRREIFHRFASACAISPVDEVERSEQIEHRASSVIGRGLRH